MLNHKKVGMIEKYCKGCDKKKSIDDFGRDKTKIDGKKLLCKSCTNGIEYSNKRKRRKEKDFWSQFSPI